MYIHKHVYIYVVADSCTLPAKYLDVEELCCVKSSNLPNMGVIVLRSKML